MGHDMNAVRRWASSLYDRATIRKDAVAGLVLGVESVPDGLADSLLAGVNHVHGVADAEEWVSRTGSGET